MPEHDLCSVAGLKGREPLPAVAVPGQCRSLAGAGPALAQSRAEQQGKHRQHAPELALHEAGSLLPKSTRRSGIQGALPYRGGGGD